MDYDDYYDDDDDATEYRIYVIDDHRNAPPRAGRVHDARSRDARGGTTRPAPRPGSAGVPAPRGQTVVRVPTRRPRPPQPESARPVRERLPEIGQVIELGSEALAAALPLPPVPPPPSDNPTIDLHNQDQHRHAIASRQLTADRIRALGKVANALSRFFAG